MGESLLFLKQRLLLRTLDQVADSGLHLMIIREAQLSQAEAMRTPFPELVLPCLFEERVTHALDQEQQCRSAYWQSVAPLHSAHNRL